MVTDHQKNELKTIGRFLLILFSLITIPTLVNADKFYEAVAAGLTDIIVVFVAFVVLGGMFSSQGVSTDTTEKVKLDRKYTHSEFQFAISGFKSLLPFFIVVAFEFFRLPQIPNEIILDILWYFDPYFQLFSKIYLSAFAIGIIIFFFFINKSSEKGRQFRNYF